MGSATVPVAVFGVAPKTRQPTGLSNAVPGATPGTARGTRALHHETRSGGDCPEIIQFRMFSWPEGTFQAGNGILLKGFASSLKCFASKLNRFAPKLF